MASTIHVPDDPTETTNLAHDPSYANKVAEMKQFVLDQLTEYRQAPDHHLSSVTAADPKHYGGIWTTGWCEEVEPDLE
jgi:hypothetical protein